MNFSTYRASLDIHASGSQAVLHAKKGETKRRILITLTERGKPYLISSDCTAVFTATKPDGNIIYNDCTIDNNIICYNFTEQTTAAEGKLDCEIRLYGADDALIISPGFDLIVDAAVYEDGDVIESGTEVSTLTALVSETNALINTVNTKLDNGEFNGPAGEAGGYYTPAVTQPYENTLRMSFSPSKVGMPAVAETDITLPSGGGGGGSGEDGGYYTPAVTQTTENTMQVSFTPSKATMPAVDGTEITLPAGPQGQQGTKGPAGADGVGIQSVEQTTTSTEDGGTNVVTVTKTDGTSSTFQVRNGGKGDKGADGKSAYQYAQEGGYTGTEAEFAEKLAQEQLTGTTIELTPTQVYEAVSAGIPVKVQYFDDTYGILSFTAFNVAESLNVIVSQTIVYANGVYILAELFGNKSNNTWGFMSTMLAQKTDIPSALPNPNAITFTGAVSATYDGSAPVSVEIPSGGGSSGGSTAEWQLLGTYTMLVSDRALTIDLSQFNGITHFRILGKFPKCSNDCGDTCIYLGTNFNHTQQTLNAQNVYAFNLLAECELVDGQLYGLIGTIDGWNRRPVASVAMNSPRDSGKNTNFKIYYTKLVEDSTENTIQIWGY